MQNGEVVFTAPWQSRMFGMAVALSEAGFFSWSEFQQQLIRCIGAWQNQPGRQQDDEYEYFTHFSAALEATLHSKGMVTPPELDARITEFRQRPHGHDHHH